MYRRSMLGKNNKNHVCVCLWNMRNALAQTKHYRKHVYYIVDRANCAFEHTTSQKTEKHSVEHLEGKSEV